MLRSCAGIAQLVERQLPKLNVAGSNPVARSLVASAVLVSRVLASERAFYRHSVSSSVLVRKRRARALASRLFAREDQHSASLLRSLQLALHSLQLLASEAKRPLRLGFSPG
jgi:hypothetical protein